MKKHTLAKEISAVFPSFYLSSFNDKIRKKSFLSVILLLIIVVPGVLNAQTLTVSGNSQPTEIDSQSETIIAPDLVISFNGSISDFTVSITNSFTISDQLGYNGPLPSGVTTTGWNASTRSIVFKGTLTAQEWQAFLRNITITSGPICSPETRQVTFVAEETFYNPLNGHFYRLTSTAQSWTDTKAEAGSTSFFGREAYLVTLTSNAENIFVSRLVGQNSWMGASDDYNEINEAVGFTLYNNQAAAEGKFYWVTGPEKGTQITLANGDANGVAGIFQNWRNGEPNNWGGSESFGHVYTGAGDWNDFPNSSNILGIMEFGGMPNDQTISTPFFTKDISINGAPGGEITGGEVTVCSGINSTTLTITGLDGSVVRWESSDNNFIDSPTIISNTSTSLTVDNISTTTYYRAVVNTNAPTGCSGLVTSSTPIYVAQVNSGNVFAQNTTICENSDVELFLSGQEGNVQKWQRSTDNTNWTDISETTTTLNETLTTAGTYYYRAVVEIPSCGLTANTASKEITVISGTPPVGGTVSSEVHPSTTNSGTLALTGYTGTISKWQSSTDNGIIWTDISNTSTTYTYSNIATKTLFRAVLTNGSCGSTFSTPGSVTILSAPSITSFNANLAGNGDTVTILGSSFTGTTAVQFGNANASSFTVVSDTEITAVVGTGASGNITVTNPAGNDSASGFTYLVAQYDFEGNALDETENNYDGIEVNTVTYGTGAQGQAICFDNGPGFVRLPDGLISGLSEFTISLRFKTTGTGAILGYQNVSASTSNSPSNWIPILMVTSDGRLKGTLWTSANISIQAVSTNAVNDGNWHQVDFTAGTNSVAIYVDGVLQASQSGASVAHLDMDFNQLGFGFTNGYNQSPTTWEYFNGCLDDILIIDRALTVQEIEAVTALPEPTIVSFTPTEAGEEDTVVITGTNFDGATRVTFGGTDATSYTVDSATQITAVIDIGATGDVAVTTAGGTATVNGFTFTSKTVITTSVSSLNSIIYCDGEASSALNFDVSASDVYQDMVITSPAGFEVSLLENSGFSSSITIAPIANAISNTTIYTRVAANQSGRFSGNISVFSGTITENIAVNAETNNSLYFDGVDDFVSLSGNSLQDGATAFTIEAWILPDNSNYDGEYHAIFGRQQGDINTRNPSFYIIDGQIHIDAYEDNTLTRFDGLDPEPRVLQDVWTHIALVKDGTEFRVYINGAFSFSCTAPSAVNISGPYQIGFIDNYFAGKIDDIRFWDVSRTATEIVNNMDTALTGNETGLVGYYTFNEGVADGTNMGLTTLQDKTASANDGTLNNFALTGNTSNWVQGYFSQISGSNEVAVGAQTQLSHLESGGVWTSNDTNIATVNQSGLVTGVALGTVEISYVLCGQTTVKNVEVNNPPGFTKSETALTIAENAGTDTFTVVLDAQPTSDVVLDVSSDDTNEATVSVAQLTFTTADWDTPQTITVTGLNDDIDRDDSATITVSINDASSDDAFDALADQTVAITLTDDDVELTYLTISSDNNSPEWAKEGDMVYIDFAFANQIENAVVQVLGATLTFDSTPNNGEAYQGWVVVDENTTEGLVALTLTVNTNSNNLQYTATTDGSIVTVDTTAPVPSLVIAESLYFGPFDIELRFSEEVENIMPNPINVVPSNGVPTAQLGSFLQITPGLVYSSTVTPEIVGEIVFFNDFTDIARDLAGNPSVPLGFVNGTFYDLDTDGDGTGDNADDDDDNDGTPDSEDDFPLDGNEDTDTDGDGTGDNADDDDDNDGTPDSEDDFPLDENEDTDTDGDGTGDNADDDDDNDGTPDSEDDFPLDENEDTDTDGDGTGDNADDDIDGDGIPNEEDLYPNGEAEDRDNDGVPDADDDFPDDPNESVDSDGDGQGDNSDTDDDNDGVLDNEDAFPWDSEEHLDTDGDGIGDNSDSDDDNDGISDAQDVFPKDPSESKDTDGDGIGDNTDADDDNDGVEDMEDAFPTNKQPTLVPAQAFTPNGDGNNDAWVIPGIDNYPNNVVKVFNRWGNLVYEANSYQNDWEGFYKENREKLPPGSYLYVIDLGDGSQVIRGWIFLNY